MKKILFAAAAIAGFVLVPVLALAAATPPDEVATFTVPVQNSLMATAGTKMMYPCVMEYSSQGSDMMYKQNPCGSGEFMPQVKFFNSHMNGVGPWLGIMFVMTVALVWTIMLLIIALLWKTLNRKHHKS